MTQSATPTFGTSQLVGILMGVGLVVAAILGLAWQKRRQKASRNERPPQGAKLRRPAGYSLQCRIDDLSDKWTAAIMQSLMAGAVLGLVGAALYPIAEGLILQRFTFAQVQSEPRSYLLLSMLVLCLASLAWLIANLISARDYDNEIRNSRFGMRGEQAVAEALADGTVAAADYVAFHDVPGDGPWNIDHVVVGPGGIFVLETKTRSRRKATRDQPEHEVRFDGENLQFPWCDDRKVVRQVERNAEWVREFVDGFAPKDLVVHPIIVVPGWYVKTQGNFPVKAMNAKYLAGYLPSVERWFTQQDLQAVIRRFDERCRDLEF